MSTKPKRAKNLQKPKQLTLPLETIECRYHGDCAAPICPRDVCFGSRIWFPKEEVCRLRSAPDWVRKQRQIARLPEIDTEKYFTFRMLNAIPRVRRQLQGANPDLVTAERIWFKGRVGKKARKQATASDAGLAKLLF